MKVTRTQFRKMQKTLHDLIVLQSCIQRECNMVDPTDPSNAAGFMINSGDSISQAVRNYGRAVGALDEHWTAK